MAIITIADVRRILKDGFYTSGQTHTITKAKQITLEQDLEDWFEGQRSILVSGLDARATQFGVVWAGAHKKRIVRNFLKRKFEREGG